MLKPQSRDLILTEFGPRAAPAALPLVSFIVVNYNYGRFLRQCVDSIFAQTYPAVECVIVDNKSTDESQQIIAELKAQYPSLKVIFEDQNLGQSAACLDGFKKTRGQYVVFTDADDYYLESFAETHVLVHLSLREAPGFTSSDMMQEMDSEIVLGSIFQCCTLLSRGALSALKPNTPRDFSSALGADCSLSVDVGELSLRSVTPKLIEWAWAPTSGSMYRRNALEMFVDASRLRTLRCSTDTFFNFAINAFAGSVLIEKPLAIYRIHRSNIFTKHPALNNVRNFRAETDLGAEAAGLALDHVLANMAVFYNSAINPWLFSRAIATLFRKSRQKQWKSLEPLHIKAMRIFWSLLRRFPG